MKYSTQDKRLIDVALQPPLNLTQKLGSVNMQIQSCLVIINSVVNESIVKFVQVTLFVKLPKLLLIKR